MELTDFVEEYCAPPRKDLAETLVASFDRLLTSAVFAMLDGAAGRTPLIEHLRRAARSDTRVKAMRGLYVFLWSIVRLNLPEAG